MQNRIDKQYTAEELQQMDDALTSLEGLLVDLPILSGEEKASSVRAPDNSRGWMEQMVVRAQQNLERLPRDFDPALLQRDLDFSNAMIPRLLRAQRIVDRLQSGIFLADSDAFAGSLEARRHLKDAGVAGIDENLNNGMTRFFNRNSSTTKPSPAAAQK